MAKLPDLERHLSTLLPQDTRTSLIQAVIPSLILSIAQISTELRKSQNVSQVGTANAFGDEQLNVDVLAERIIRRGIEDVASIVTASSEEDPVERRTNPQSTEGSSSLHGAETYTLAFDPLDGSSIIAPNWTVGTIIGVWDGASALGVSPATHQIASILGVFGPRTTAVVALRVPGAEPTCFEVGLGTSGADESEVSCEVIRSSIRLDPPPFKTRYFAPANLRAAAEDDRYMRLVTGFIADKYTLRYSGGLVPDIVHALVKGHGLYVSPVTGQSKAKLRKIYELMPVALIMECVGGKAVDAETGSRILDQEVNDCDERAGVICGTQEEVDKVLGMFDLRTDDKVR